MRKKKNRKTKSKKDQFVGNKKKQIYRFLPALDDNELKNDWLIIKLKYKYTKDACILIDTFDETDKWIECGI